MSISSCYVPKPKLNYQNMSVYGNGKWPLSDSLVTEFNTRELKKSTTNN